MTESSGTRPRSRMKDLGVCLLLVVTIRLVYGLVPEFSFVGFDDDRRMLLNEHVVSGLTWENISWSFTSDCGKLRILYDAIPGGKYP